MPAPRSGMPSIQFFLAVFLQSDCATTLAVRLSPISNCQESALPMQAADYLLLTTYSRVLTGHLPPDTKGREGFNSMQDLCNTCPVNPAPTERDEHVQALSVLWVKTSQNRRGKHGTLLHASQRHHVTTSSRGGCLWL